MKLLIAIVLAVCAGQFIHVVPAAAEDLQALLARPMTPGSVALLVEHVMEPAVQKRLIEAVKHEDPAVRAVAARIAFVTTSRGLAPPLIATVAKETNTHTAVEQIRALMGMLGEPVDTLVLRHVQRLGGPTAKAMTESLARTRPKDLVKHLNALLDAAGEADTLGGPIAVAIIQHPAAANDILQAVLASKNVALLESILSTTRDRTDIAFPSAMLVQALRSGEEDQRSAIVWHLFDTFHTGDGAECPPGCLAAAAPRPAAATAAAADHIVLLFNKQYLACADDPFPPVRPRFDPSPTLLDGQPIETYMTYTVSFRR